MRRVFSFVLSAAVAVSFLSGISSSAAAAGSMAVTNYGTSDGLIFGPDKICFFLRKSDLSPEVCFF